MNWRDWLDAYWPALERREVRMKVLKGIALALPVLVILLTLAVLAAEGVRP